MTKTEEALRRAATGVCCAEDAVRHNPYGHAEDTLRSRVDALRAALALPSVQPEPAPDPEARDAETWARAIESSAGAAEQPADWRPLPYQLRLAKAIRRLAPEWIANQPEHAGKGAGR